MKEIIFNIGLPRSGSTVLMNILQQNPGIFTTGTCPTPYLVDACKFRASEVSEFLAMKQDVLSDALTNFLKYGIDGWFTALTDKPTIISKSRTWDMYLPLLFNMYDNPKFIFCTRDLRDIVVSFEKLLEKYPHLNITHNGTPFHLKSMDDRIKNYITDTTANLGLPLSILPHIYETMRKYPNNFFLFRFEDFNRNPKNSLKSLYQWLEKDYYEHDLNNIQQSEVYEHDSIYRALVSHETYPQYIQHPEENWKKYLTEEQSQTILHNCQWYYQTFYPELC